MNILIKLMSIVSLVIAPHIALDQAPAIPEAPIEINKQINLEEKHEVPAVAKMVKPTESTVELSFTAGKE